MKNKLWADLKTDEERVEFLRSGRAWETGIISAAIVDDVAAAFEFRLQSCRPPSVTIVPAGEGDE